MWHKERKLGNWGHGLLEHSGSLLYSWLVLCIWPPWGEQRHPTMCSCNGVLSLQRPQNYTEVMDWHLWNHGPKQIIPSCTLLLSGLLSYRQQVDLHTILYTDSTCILKILRQSKTRWIHSCSLALDNGSETQTNEVIYLNPMRIYSSLCWSFHISK